MSLHTKEKNRLMAISWCPYELFHLDPCFLLIVFRASLSCHHLKSKQFYTLTLYFVFHGPDGWLGATYLCFSSHCLAKQCLEWRCFWRWFVLCFPFPSPHFLFMQLPVCVSAVGGVLQSLTSPFVFYSGWCIMSNLWAGRYNERCVFPDTLLILLNIFMLIRSQVKISHEN